MFGLGGLGIKGLLPLVLVAIGQIVGILDGLLLWLGLAQLIAVRGGVRVLDGGIRLQGPLPVAAPRLAPVVAVILVVVLMVGMFNVYNLVRKYARRVP